MSNRARHFTLCIVLCCLLLPMASLRPGAAAAATPITTYTFTVNTTNDTHDSKPGDGKCMDSNGQCSLRAAIEESDALPSGSSITITVPAGTYALTLGTLGLTANTITINGAGRKTTTIKGNKTFGIVSISAGVNASLNGLTIEGGKTGVIGGGIKNDGILAVSNSTISRNSAPDGYGGGGGIYNAGMLTVSTSTISRNSAGAGGGIYNAGMLTVSTSTFSGNSAYGGNSHGYGFGSGGGIFNYGIGTMSVSSSTFSGNSATGPKNDVGGGIANYYSSGTSTVSTSTFSGNSAGGKGSHFGYGYGGGIYNNDGGYGGTLSVSNSTISGNRAENGYGGGITNDGNTVTLTATIVANNLIGSNCAGTFTDGGYNLDSGTSCGFKRHTDLTKTNPKLGPLGHNGGPTQTMALLQGSKAIDWVALNSCPATDQRGYTRPDGSGESACDIGAYESAY